MTTVTVRYLLGLGEGIRCRKEHVMMPSGATVRELLEELFQRYGPGFRREILDDAASGVRSHILILVNGIALARLKDGLDTTLSTGDVVIFTRPISGG